MLSYTQQREHSLNGFPSKFGRVVPSVFEVRRGNFFIYSKSCFSYFCIKAIIATISTHTSQMQLNASKVTILPPPHEASRLYTVMRCAKQRDYSPIHILPHSTLFVYTNLEIVITFCKFAPLYIDGFYTIRQTKIYRGIAG